jgi:hypothetical protein
MKKALSIAAALALFAAALPLRAQGEAAVKVFALKYKRVEEAALLIRGNLSPSASVTLAPRLNAMTVTDREENLRTIEKILANFDRPPRGFTVAVKLVRARADAPAGSISKEIGGLGTLLASYFHFNDYALIDSAVLRSIEGQEASCRLGDDYQISFTIGRSGFGDVLILSPFVLSKMRKDGQGRPAPVQLYRTAMPVEVNQTLVVGASRDEASKTALIVILLVQELPAPGNNEKGPPGTKTVEKEEKKP